MDRPRRCSSPHLERCGRRAEHVRSRWINLVLILVLAQTVGFYGCVGTTGAQLTDPPTEPRLSTNPSNVNFGDVMVGSSVAQSIALTNSGTANLTVSQAVVSGTGFSVSGLSTPMTLPPGQNSTFTVRFAPQAAGNATGSISLGSNASGSPATVRLAGNGAGSPPPPTLQLSLSPPSIVFGNVTVGTSSTRTAALNNTGTGSVTVSSANASGAGFSLNGLSLPLTLAAGQTANFNVVFAPTATGSVSGGVTVVSNASNSPATSTLSGAGTPPATPQLTVDPTSVDFGQILVGSNSSRTVTLTSSGTANLTISQATVTGTGFSISGLSTPLTLAPGQNTTFTVRFAPQVPGGVTGSISLSSNAPNSPANIALAGTGAAVTMLLGANPTSLTFGDVVIGRSATQTVMLTNSGNSTVTISQINVSGSAFSTTGLTPPMTLGAGQTTALSVVFTPAAQGAVSGSVSVVSNATNSPATISLGGSGVPPMAHSVSLNWDASASAVVGYNVYRGAQSGGPYTKLNSTPVSGTTYTDSTVQAGQTYFYVVTAVDSAGVESVFSAEAWATIPTP